MCCSAVGAGCGVLLIRAEQHGTPPIKPLTPALSQREGRPLSWAPSADAVAGGGEEGAQQAEQGIGCIEAPHEHDDERLDKELIGIGFLAPALAPTAESRVP